MSRILNVGGRQGRGNPYATRRSVQPDARPDRLALIVASHLLHATPGVRIDWTHPRASAVAGARSLLRRRERALRMAGAVAAGAARVLRAVGA